MTCDICKKSDHITLLHPDSEAGKDHEEEGTSPKVSNMCMDICDSPESTSKSCSKIILVYVYPKGTFET